MSLASTLKSVISRLRSDDLENEEEVKLAVISPILLALDWNPAQSGSIKPEYPAGRGRVDYALLCHGRPQVFIEAKRRGALDVRAEGQLFGYASNQGIPLLVLTDGHYWDFYLSMADGLPEERRFYRLDLLHEDRMSEYVEFLESHLARHRVASGEARRSAETWLERNREREQARKAIPSAWNSLSNEPDELLRELLAEKVLHVSGAKPDYGDIDDFLKSLSHDAATFAGQGLSTKSKPPKFTGGTTVSDYRDPVESRRGTTDSESPQLSPRESRRSESLQTIVQDLMLCTLEMFPGTIDEDTISHLEVTKNPLGLKIGGHTLLRKISEGRAVGRHNRYWKRSFSGQWYVCSQWWKDDHYHNANILAEWVNHLISDVHQSEERNSLMSIRRRLDSFMKDMN